MYPGGETSAPPAYNSVVNSPPHSKYTINSDTEPILPAPITTNVSVVTNPILRTLNSTSVGTWFILHSLFITLLLIPCIIAAKEGFIQIAIACYIFIVLFAAFSKKISVLYAVVGMAVFELIVGFLLFFAAFMVTSRQLAQQIDLGSRVFFAFIVLIFISLSGSQLYLSHMVLKIAKSRLIPNNGVFVSVSTRIGR